VDSVSANFAACISSYIVYYQQERYRLSNPVRLHPSSFCMVNTFTDTSRVQPELLTEWVLRTHRFMLVKEILDTGIPPIEIDVKPIPVPGDKISPLGHRIMLQMRTCVLGYQIGRFFLLCREVLVDP